MRNLSLLQSLDLFILSRNYLSLEDLSIDLFNIRNNLLLTTCNNRHAIEAFKDYNYLGTRVRGDGMVGE